MSDRELLIDFCHCLKALHVYAETVVVPAVQRLDPLHELTDAAYDAALKGQPPGSFEDRIGSFSGWLNQLLVDVDPGRQADEMLAALRAT